MDGKSITPREIKLEQLREIMPEVFSEGKVDFERLKAILGEDIDFNNERYRLNWAGKSDAFRALQIPSTKTLVPVKDESIDFNNTQNIFIEGENLEVLKVLQKSYFGKIKMIYIDPPYNTGNDSFIYPDKFSESKEDYQKRVGDKDDEGYMTGDGMFRKNSKENGQYHSNWLNMMYPRLFLAKNLLREDGVIFVSIDDNEVHNLRLLMNEIFGEENFVATIANINNPKGRSDDAFIATSHEYLIVAAKSIGHVNLSGFKPDEKIIKRYNKMESDRKYREIDLRKTGENDLREDRENLFYYFHYNENTGEFFPSRDNNSQEGFIVIKPLREDLQEGNWRWGIETSKKEIHKLTPKFMPHRKIWGVMEKDFLDTRAPVKSTSTWHFKDVNSERGSEQFTELGFDKKVYPKPKPLGTLKRVIELSDNDNEDFITLDFFAGSGSFGHASYEYNYQNRKNMKFILVQIPEKLDTEKKEHKAAISFLEGIKKELNYAEIAKERIRRASKKIADEIKAENNKKKEELDFDQNREEKKADLGFKVLRLADSNFKKWRQIEGNDITALEEQMKIFIDPVSENATIENMVYELILKSGKSLNSSIVHKQGYFTINGNEIILLLEKATYKIIDAVIAEKPLKVIALDRLFKGNDQLKTNTALQMKDAGIEFKTI